MNVGRVLDRQVSHPVHDKMFEGDDDPSDSIRLFLFTVIWLRVDISTLDCITYLKVGRLL